MPLEHLRHGPDRPAHRPPQRLRIVWPPDREHVGRDDRHDLPRLEDTRRRGRRALLHQLERRVLYEDGTLQPLQRGAGLETELLDEHLARLLVDAESFRLTAGPVEREHELRAQPLAERVLGDERLELGDEVCMTPELELGLDPVLGGSQPQLLEPCRLGARERRVREVGEHRPPPELERVTQPGRSLRRVAGGQHRSRLLDQALEAIRVQLAHLDPQHVPGTSCDE